MGILQEYRFYFIVALIALGAMVVLFFNLSSKREYVEYNTQMKEKYVSAKSLDAPEGPLKFLLAGDTGITNLFGKTLSGTVADIKLVDATSFSTLESITLNPDNYRVFYYTEGVLPTGTIDLGSIDETSSPEEKGVTLDTTGYTVYVFSNEEEAQSVLNTYIPEGILKDNKIFVNFEGRENPGDIGALLATLYPENLPPAWTNFTPEEILATLSSSPTEGLVYNNNPAALTQDIATVSSEPYSYWTVGDSYVYRVKEGSLWSVYWKPISEVGNTLPGTKIISSPTQSIENVIVDKNRSNMYYIKSGVVYKKPYTGVDPSTVTTGETNISPFTPATSANLSKNGLRLGYVRFGSVFERNMDTNGFVSRGSSTSTPQYTSNGDYLLLTPTGRPYILYIGGGTTKTYYPFDTGVTGTNYRFSTDDTMLLYINTNDGNKIYGKDISEELSTLSGPTGIPSSNDYGIALSTIGAQSFELREDGIISFIDMSGESRILVPTE